MMKLRMRSLVKEKTIVNGIDRQAVFFITINFILYCADIMNSTNIEEAKCLKLLMLSFIA